jgi:Protein of unknown function (DUF3343)
MGAPMEKVVIVFHSTHDAIRAERVCLRKGIRCQAIPVPRNLSAECGIALEVNRNDETAARILFEEENLSGIFHER